jgi:hypothetical protein
MMHPIFLTEAEQEIRGILPHPKPEPHDDDVRVTDLAPRVVDEESCRRHMHGAEVAVNLAVDWLAAARKVAPADLQERLGELAGELEFVRVSLMRCGEKITCKS